MPSLATTSVLVHDIWEETAHMAFAEISAMLKSGGEFLIGLDSEFAIADGAVLPGREPPTADHHYQQLCTIHCQWGELGTAGLVHCGREIQCDRNLAIQYEVFGEMA